MGVLRSFDNADVFSVFQLRPDGHAVAGTVFVPVGNDGSVCPLGAVPDFVLYILIVRMHNRRRVVGVEAGELPVERSQVRFPNAAAGFPVLSNGGMMRPGLPFVLRNADL